MSTPTATRDGSTNSSETQTDPSFLERTVPSLAKPIRVTSFWSAVVLPFLYIPLLVRGLSTSGETAVFLGLLAINLLVLYVGRSHHR